MSTNEASNWKLPILQLKHLETHPKDFVEQLRWACHNVGFFLLEYDIPSSTYATALNETRDFFERPLEQKMTISYDQYSTFRGYMKLGVENTAGRLDYREQIEYAVEEEHVQQESSPFYNRLRGTNPWPNVIQPSLQPAILNVSSHINRVADRLRVALCQALKLESTALDALFASNNEPSHWVMKLVSYPPHVTPVLDAKDPNNNSDPPLGVGAHTDTNFLTLILQDASSKTGELQVFSQGQWRSVPLEMTNSSVLICNLGEQAQIWSANYFLATPHRVLLRTTQDDGAPLGRCTGRISLPFFYNPRLSAHLDPVESTTIDALPWEREEDRHDWKRPTPDTMLTSVGENTFKSLARSHPHVFQKHHSDLKLLENGRVVPRKNL